MSDFREHAAALYEHARFLALDRVWKTGAAVAAWAYSRDLDRDLDDLLYEENRRWTR